MGKKYTPSGYQIINLKIDSSQATGTITDENLINVIKTSGKRGKPILLMIEDTYDNSNIILYPSMTFVDGYGQINSTFVNYNGDDAKISISWNPSVMEWSYDLI